VTAAKFLPTVCVFGAGLSRSGSSFSGKPFASGLFLLALLTTALNLQPATPAGLPLARKEAAT